MSSGLAMRLFPLTQDVLAGLMFMSLGLLGLWLGHDLEVGTAGAMQAGYFPRMICLLLLGLGAVLATTALFRDGVPPRGWAWRPFLCVTSSALSFVLLLKPFGLVLTLLVTVALANLAGRPLRLLPLLLLSAILIAVNVGVFVFGLGLPIPLWPRLS